MADDNKSKLIDTNGLSVFLEGVRDEVDSKIGDAVPTKISQLEDDSDFVISDSVVSVEYIEQEDFDALTEYESDTLYIIKDDETGGYTLASIATTGKLADAITDSSNRTVTDTEKAKWNSIEEKIPTITSIYSSTSTDGMNGIAVASAVSQAIEGVTQFDYQVVEALPESGVKGTIYLVANTHGTQDIYDEYIYVGSDWEKIGTTDIDLSGYVTQVNLGETSYNPTSGVISLPAYPTTLPASDVSDWAKASTKPSYAWTEITNKPETFAPSTHTHTKSQITDFPTSMPASDVSDWAKAETKPDYTFAEIKTTPTTISGYGITDAKIENGVVTLGSATITPLTSASTIPTTQISGLATVATSGAYGDLSGVPTKLSDFTDDIVSGNYLALTGGSVTGNISMTLDDGYYEVKNSTGINYIQYGNNTIKWSSSDGSGSLKFPTTNKNYGDLPHTLLTHEIADNLYFQKDIYAGRIDLMHTYNGGARNTNDYFTATRETTSDGSGYVSISYGANRNYSASLDKYGQIVKTVATSEKTTSYGINIPSLSGTITLNEQFIELTQDEYDALTEYQKNTTYYITD